MTPADSEYVARVCASFAQQRAMTYLGAVGGGFAWARRDRLAVSRGLTQQDGFVHAGIITAIVDSACGYAAFTLAPPGVGVLTVEFKVNLLESRGRGAFVARGQVVKPGRTLTVCTGEVAAERADGAVRSVALMQATMMTIREREAIAG